MNLNPLTLCSDCLETYRETGRSDVLLTWNTFTFPYHRLETRVFPFPLHCEILASLEGNNSTSWLSRQSEISVLNNKTFSFCIRISECSLLLRYQDWWLLMRIYCWARISAVNLNFQYVGFTLSHTESLIITCSTLINTLFWRYQIAIAISRGTFGTHASD